MANSGASTYFKVPNGWHKISDSSLANVLKQETGSSGGGWSVAYEAGESPTAKDFLDFGTDQPFVFAEVGELSSTASSELSYDTLRDFFLPVTSATGRRWRRGIPVHRLPADPRPGAHPWPRASTGSGRPSITPTAQADTFDEIALTNADQTEVYLLVLHCTTGCYSSDQTQINDVMTSFTIRSS